MGQGQTNSYGDGRAGGVGTSEAGERDLHTVVHAAHPQKTIRVLLDRGRTVGTAVDGWSLPGCRHRSREHADMRTATTTLANREARGSVAARRRSTAAWTTAAIVAESCIAANDNTAHVSVSEGEAADTYDESACSVVAPATITGTMLATTLQGSDAWSVRRHRGYDVGTHLGHRGAHRIHLVANDVVVAAVLGAQLTVVLARIEALY